MNLAIVECRTCGAAYWVDAELASGAIDGGACCFGHPVLDIETHPTEKSARKAYPAWQENRLATMRRIWREYHPEVAT